MAWGWVLLFLLTLLHGQLAQSSLQANGCNVYPGKWVFDKTYPFYDVSNCPYNRREFDCLKYGRTDKPYIKYRWQPARCKLPRFNGSKFLSRWRGKKIMFVGDSLSTNNWISLVCMLHAAVPPGTTSGLKMGQLTLVRFEEYNVEIVHHWQPYLVDIFEEDVGRVLRLNSLQNNGAEWKGVDLLIFNTWYWWWRKRAALPFDYFHDGKKLLKDINRISAFTQALQTWAKWADISSSKTTIVYQGVTPSHLRQWQLKSEEKNGGNQDCRLPWRDTASEGINITIWTSSSTANSGESVEFYQKACAFVEHYIAFTAKERCPPWQL